MIEKINKLWIKSVHRPQFEKKGLKFLSLFIFSCLPFSSSSLCIQYKKRERKKAREEEEEEEASRKKDSARREKTERERNKQSLSFSLTFAEQWVSRRTCKALRIQHLLSFRPTFYLNTLTKSLRYKFETSLKGTCKGHLLVADFMLERIFFLLLFKPTHSLKYIF